MNRIRLIGLILASAVTVLGCSTPPEKAAAPAGVAYSAADRAAISQYFEGYAKQLAKTTSTANYQPGDTLDPGLRPRKLPTDLSNRLGKQPEGYTSLIVGSDVILVNRDSHQIADVIPKVAY